MPRHQRRPWSAFYWSDWLSDPAVRAMSRDERGAYLDILAFTHQTRRPGVMAESDAMRWSGYSEAEWATHQDAIFRAFRRDRKGRWIQLRVVREQKIARNSRERLSEAGRKGAAITNYKQRRYAASVRQGPSRGLAAARPQSQSQSQIEAPAIFSAAISPPTLPESGSWPPPPAAVAAAADNGTNGEERCTAREAFDIGFWRTYPRKVGRIAAERAFLRVIRDGPETDELFAAMMRGLRWYVDTEWANRDPDKIPHAATWLNQRRWEDAESP